MFDKIRRIFRSNQEPEYTGHVSTHRPFRGDKMKVLVSPAIDDRGNLKWLARRLDDSKAVMEPTLRGALSSVQLNSKGTHSVTMRGAEAQWEEGIPVLPELTAVEARLSSQVLSKDDRAIFVRLS